MSRVPERLDRRHHRRVRLGVACKLLVDGRSTDGVVSDVCARGLYVQSETELVAGTAAFVMLRTPDGSRFLLETAVSQLRRQPQSLASVTRSGLSLRIEDPPSAYLRWVEGVPS